MPWGVQMYTPQSDPVRAYKAAIAAAVAEEYGGPLISDPVSLSCVFVFARPAAMRGSERLIKATKPDLDNLEKAVQDALTGSLLIDDNQVAARGRCAKWYAAKGEMPHTLICVQVLEKTFSIQGDEWNLSY